MNMTVYANGGRIAGQYHEWVQDALSVTVAIYRKMGLETNLNIIKAMVFTPGLIWGKWGEQAYTRRATG